jgi:hypothetical protein
MERNFSGVCRHAGWCRPFPEDSDGRATQAYMPTHIQTKKIDSAAQLRRAPPLGHLFAYLLASNFIAPMQVPAALKADA